MGASALATFVSIEEISKACATSGLIVAVQELGALAFKLSGSDEQKRRFLPRLASGEMLAAYALTEPGLGLRRGRDAHRGAPRRRRLRPRRARSASSRTRASPASTSSSRRPTPRRAIAASRPSQSSRTRRGSRSAGSSRRWGSRARRRARSSSTAAVCPAENRIGEEGEGFRLAMRILDRSRPGIAAQALGIAQGATDYALEYARTRETMGEPIAPPPAGRRACSPTWRRSARRRAGCSTAAAR